MGMKFLIILLIITTIRAENYPVVTKCCPDGYIIQDSIESRSDNKYFCVENSQDMYSEWHPEFNTKIHTVIPRSKSEIMKLMYDHCSDENIISLPLTGNEDIVIHGNQIQMTIPDSFVINITKEEVCFDRIFTQYDQHEPTGHILKYCPCKRENCVYICCATVDIERFSSPSNWKCGYTESEWEAPLQESIFSTPGLNDVVLEKVAPPSVECLRTVTPFQEMRHPGILTHHKFTIDQYGNLITGQNRLPRAKYCLGLENNDDHNLKAVAYSCKSDSSVDYEQQNRPTNPNRIFVLEGGRFNAPNHTWLAIVGVVITVISLGLLVISSKHRTSFAGVSLIGYCISMLLAFLCIAFLPLAWGNEVYSFVENTCNTLASLIQFALLFAFSWFYMRIILMFAELKCVPNVSLTRFSSTKSLKWWYYLLLLINTALMPVVVTMVSWSSQEVGTPTTFIPNIHEGKIALCWFRTWLTIITSYLIPMLVMILVQIVMFITILVKRSRANKDKTTSVAYEIDDLQNDRQIICCFVLTSLFGLIIFACEVVCYHFPYYWYSLSGVLVVRALFVLVVFCIKPKVWSSIANTVCGCCLKQKQKAKEKAEIYKQKEREKSFYDPQFELQTKSGTM